MVSFSFIFLKFYLISCLLEQFASFFSIRCKFEYWETWKICYQYVCWSRKPWSLPWNKKKSAPRGKVLCVTFNVAVKRCLSTNNMQLYCVVLTFFFFTVNSMVFYSNTRIDNKSFMSLKIQIFISCQNERVIVLAENKWRLILEKEIKV